MRSVGWQFSFTILDFRAKTADPALERVEGWPGKSIVMLILFPSEPYEIEVLDSDFSDQWAAGVGLVMYEMRNSTRMLA